MTTRAKIDNSDWEFIGKVARAAFANPFSERRDELDALIGGVGPDVPADQALQSVMEKVRLKVEGLRREGRVTLESVEGERREMLRAFFFFDAFHRLVAAFDGLIQTQIKSGDAPCKVSFARDAVARMIDFGLTEPDALRTFAFFYQLRRAFYFIKNGLLGNSGSIRTLRKHLWNCVFTSDTRWFESRLWERMEDFSILLLGETGTGKGAAAAAIGRSGFIPYDPKTGSFAESFTKNFVAINLSQFSEGLLESELFGHKKGAFTGAVENHEGVFSRCPPHGVIFLDEIGEVSIQVQIKLLQVLQDRIFYPVGSHQPRRFSGRVVAATNRHIPQLLSEGRFREDFYYRLCSDIVTIPSLRQRLTEDRDELDTLLGGILSRISGEEAPQRERNLIRKVLERDLGLSYAWPGNVRELEQAVKRVILTGHYKGMTAAETTDEAKLLATAVEAGDLDAQSLVVRYCKMLYRRLGTYEEVARRTNLDRRTVKKYVTGEE